MWGAGRPRPPTALLACTRCGPRRQWSPSSCPRTTQPRMCGHDAPHVRSSMPSGPRARVPDCHLWFPILFFVVLKEDKKKKKGGVGWGTGLQDVCLGCWLAGWAGGRSRSPQPMGLWECMLSRVFLCEKPLCRELRTVSGSDGVVGGRRLREERSWLDLCASQTDRPQPWGSELQEAGRLALHSCRECGCHFFARTWPVFYG